MKKTKNLMKIGLGLILGLACVAFRPAPAKTSAPTPNSTATVNGPIGSSEAVVLPYDGTETPAYGFQAYAGVNGPAWVVDGAAGEWSPHINGDTSHRFGSNHGDGRNGLEVTCKFNSTVEGEAMLNMYLMTGTQYGNATFTENGFVSGVVDLASLTPNMECGVPTPVQVTVQKGINTYTFKMQDDYTAWFCTFSLGAINARNETVTNDESNLTTTNNPAVAYYGSVTKIYGFQAYAKISGASWTCGNGDIFERLQDGSTSHSIGSNTGDHRSGLTFELNINSYVAEEAFLDTFVKISQWDKASKITLTVNGTASQIDLCELQPIEWNYQRRTQLPLTLVKGNNTVKIVLQDNYTAWFGGFCIGPKDTDRATFHDTYTKNYDTPAVEAQPVKFTGGVSEVFSVQQYAGVDQTTWVSDNTNHAASTGHLLGSNADKESTTFTFKVDSEIAADVIFNLYVEHYINPGLAQYKAEVGGELTVNDGTAKAINFYDITGNSSSANEATPLDVTLVKGMNTIKIKMVYHYKAWFGGFQLAAGYDTVNISSWSNKQGAISADQWAIGLNAFDNAADYGKTGSVDYVFYTQKAGLYNFDLSVMAGAKLANRFQFKVNGTAVLFDNDNNEVKTGGHDYWAAPTDAGWTYAPRSVRFDLPEGKVVLTIGNKLANVSADKSTEVPEGTAGSVKVSNWWLNKLEISKVPENELFIDTSNASTTFAIGRQFNSDGLVVKYIDHLHNETVTTLTKSQYTVDSSAFDRTHAGSYKIVVTAPQYSMSKSYYVNVTNDQWGNLGEYKGDVLEFDGKTEAKQSFYYCETIGEGTGVCEGRIAGINYNGGATGAGDNGYEVGSAGVGEYENRQVTFKLHINSKRAGQFMLSLFLKSEYANNGNFEIKVNNEESYQCNLYFSHLDKPYKTMVNLQEGENVITLKSPQQYSCWFSYYSISPLPMVFVGTEQVAKNGLRWGEDLVSHEESDGMPWLASDKQKSLSFAYTVVRNGQYEFQMSTQTSGQKTAEIKVDGQKVCDATIVNGVSKVQLELDAGVHIITIYCAGSASTSFNLTKVNLVKYLSVKALVLDTKDVTTQVKYDGLISYSNLKVTAVYSDNSRKVLNAAEYTVVEPEGLSTKRPGTYTFEVVLTDDANIKATFNVTVAEQSVEPVDPQPQQGCFGSITIAASTLVIAGLGIAVLSLKKKEEK